MLVAVTLPRAQTVADAVTVAGLRALHLPDTYPRNANGTAVSVARCRTAGSRVRAEGLRGVWARSALGHGERGRELAWFPASVRSRARPVWEAPLPLGAWRDAAGWDDLGLETQPDPR
ncbi:MAG: hypothetical protein ABFS34_07930 [Gemmatimonadota bacterium]